MFHWHCINVFTWNTSQKNGTNDVQLRCFCWFQHNWYEFENRDGIKNTHTNRNSVCIHICLPSSMETLFRALFMDHIGAGSSHPIQESRCFRQLICLNAWGGSNSQFKTHKNFFFHQTGKHKTWTSFNRHFWIYANWFDISVCSKRICSSSGKKERKICSLLLDNNSMVSIQTHTRRKKNRTQSLSCSMSHIIELDAVNKVYKRKLRTTHTSFSILLRSMRALLLVSPVSRNTYRFSFYSWKSNWVYTRFSLTPSQPVTMTTTFNTICTSIHMCDAIFR